MQLSVSCEDSCIFLMTQTSLNIVTGCHCRCHIYLTPFSLSVTKHVCQSVSMHVDMCGDDLSVDNN